MSSAIAIVTIFICLKYYVVVVHSVIQM